MRIASLSLLLATVSAFAVPVAAQDTTAKPPVVTVPVTPPPPRPAVVMMAPPVAEPPAAIPEVWAPVPTDGEGRSAYGLYLSGRLAQSRGDTETAADLFQATEALTPEQPAVREQAFMAAVFGGDLDFAARMTPRGADVSPALTQTGRLIEVVQAFVHDDPAAALAIYAQAPIGQPNTRAADFVRSFLAAGAGDRETALALPNLQPNDPVLLLSRYHRAILLEHYGEFDEADKEYAALMASRGGAPLFRLPYGEFLERRGRRPEAIAFYDAAFADHSADARTATARDRAVAGRRPPAALTLHQGAAVALKDAAILASIEGGHEFAAIYLRLALSLNADDDTRLRLGQSLAEAGMEGAARDALDFVSPAQDHYYSAARSEIALSLQREDRDEEALVELRRAHAATPDDTQTAYLLASQLVELKQYDAAMALLNGPVLNTANQGFAVRFLRGAAYESLGDIPRAEAELWAAHQLKPDDATVMNYLGYLWVDKGLRVEQGAAMIAQAFAADPENGNVQDSLGWSQYRQGQYDAAVASLEAAVTKEPANPEVNNHLGDAYWQVGRQREARFQWSRVLTLNPDAEQRADAERKLAQGLEPATPVSNGAER
ncbi:MAG: tetratricopeptide repeat protein [Pseudomonadota bacterium]